jgi:beta-lactamase class A
MLQSLLTQHDLYYAAVVLHALPGREFVEPYEISLNTDAPIYPASMIKLPLAIAAIDAVERGILATDDLHVHDHHITSNDAYSPLVAGETAALWDLIGLMISRSDNIATNVLLDAVGRVRGTEILRDVYGCKNTHLRRYLSGSDPRIIDRQATGENEHSARDCAHLFTLVAQSQIPHADRLIEALEQQYWNGKLSAGLHRSDRFAHKTGDTSDVSHDGGILTLADGSRYVVVLYTRCSTSDDTDRKFADFMRELRPWLFRQPATK